MGDRAQEALSVRAAVDIAGTLQRIARAERFDVLGGGCVADLVQGCALFDVMDAAGPRASFALRVDQFQGARVLTVTAAGGDSAAGCVAAMVAFAEREAQRIGATVLTCETRRRGLVRVLERHGYRVAGFVMKKDT
ncbi:hypothetical protein [Roseateles violae]|uniref:N-acetyltransferase domain-containing protein n=1 Tax=Roseateles violae TaxID=3058042 RepID=A0ABT8E0C3_9BURK|nr:hypothetical protein [Pelomonas sp. PFR6]MDN3923313.1 hypothetical protein [Pelomonas sp. PFR6]